MIKIVIGGIGSGKSVSLARDAIHRRTKTYINFPLYHPNAIRLKEEHIIKNEVIGQKKNGENIEKAVINFDFWRETWQKEGFSIILD